VQNNKRFFGKIEVICGSMFSGKTEELIRRLNRAKIARKRIEIFKPIVDNRYSDHEIVSHNKNSIASMSVTSSESILLLAKDKEVIGIDEAQFFDENLIQVVNTLADEGLHIIIAGLDMDFQKRPFGIMPQLMAIADEVHKVHAICMVCGESSMYSKRLIQNQSTILIGEKESYEPRCRKCYEL